MVLTVIYIAGHARSGSTALETWLNATGAGNGLGEVRDVFLFAEKRRLCSCGDPIDQCSWWAPIVTNALKESELNLRDAVTLTDGVENGVPLFCKSKHSIESYKCLWSALWRSIQETGINTVIDSSKSHRVVRKRLLLMNDMPIRTIPIVLERSRSATVRSAKSIGAQYGGGAPFRRIPLVHDIQASLAWLVSNVSAAASARQFDRSILCAYEELDQSLLESILFSVNRFGNENPGMHCIGGNRHRFVDRTTEFKQASVRRKPSSYLRLLMGNASRSWIKCRDK